MYTRREIVRQRIRLAEGKCPSTAIQTTSYRLSMQPVRSARLRPTQSPITAVNVWVKPARTPVRLERSAWEIPRRTSTQINAASAESVPRHAHTMRLPIWSARKKVCPVDAITYDEYGICVIDEKKCIQCGACIHSCPFGAIGSKTFMVDVIRLINAGKRS